MHYRFWGLLDSCLAAVEQKTRALQLQYRYVANMAQMPNSIAIINALIHAVSELTHLNDITLWLSPQLDGQFSCHYPANAELSAFNAKDCPDGVTAQAFMDKQLWLRSDQTEAKLHAFDASLFQGRAIMSVPLPLHIKEGVLGFLNLAGEAVEFETGTLEALTGMADVTATALQSYWHREAFDEAQDAIITALAKLSEYRDPETGTHLLRLKIYCELICRFLTEEDKYHDIVSPEFTLDLVRSSPLHDIGKVGIPDAILKKPGQLTPDEFEIMKTHAQFAATHYAWSMISIPLKALSDAAWKSPTLITKNGMGLAIH
jgi:hypothetical protein